MPSKTQSPASQLMKSGEFAEYCGTTKETLRHYKNIGLLSPAAMSEAGYALYSSLQWANFMLISSLQSSGCSLVQIREYLNSPASKDLEAVLEGCVSSIKAERRRLLEQQHLLENTLTRAQTLSSWLESGDQFCLEQCEEERFHEIPIPTAEADSAFGSEAFDELMKSYLDPDTRHPRAELQNTYRMDRVPLMRGEAVETLYACLPAVRGLKNTRKPAGLYLKWLRQFIIADGLEDYSAVLNGYGPLLDELRRRGTEPLSDFYETELSLYTGNITETSYTEVSVRIG